MSSKTKKLDDRLVKVQNKLARLAKKADKLTKKSKRSRPAVSDLHAHLQKVEDKIKAIRKR